MAVLQSRRCAGRSSAPGPFATPVRRPSIHRRTRRHRSSASSVASRLRTGRLPNRPAAPVRGVGLGSRTARSSRPTAGRGRQPPSPPRKQETRCKPCPARPVDGARSQCPPMSRGRRRRRVWRKIDPPRSGAGRVGGHRVERRPTRPPGSHVRRTALRWSEAVSVRKIRLGLLRERSWTINLLGSGCRRVCECAATSARISLIGVPVHAVRSRRSNLVRHRQNQGRS